MRDEVTAARRIVVKVGSSSLTSPVAAAPGRTVPSDSPAALGGLSGDRVDALVDALSDRMSAGTEIVLVSSGAIATGLSPLALRRRPRDLATQQAAASVGQGLLIARYTASFARYGHRVGQVLLTADDVTRRSHYRNAYRTLARLLELGVVPIVNENDTVATQEIKFGDNDRLASLVAHLVRADLLVLLSDVDALYDGDPSRPGSRQLTDVYGPQDLDGIALGPSRSSGVGTGGMVTKVEAARIATVAGIPVVLTRAAHAGRALRGEPVGTLFHRTGSRGASRLLWLEHATQPQGALRLDTGAVDAVVRRRLSLLPAGILGVEGKFAAGDPVDLLDEAGTVVARGLVNYDASELPDLLGRSTHELAAAYGPQYEREVVHRDDLVVLA